jgi:hypothetical protein
VGDVIKEMFYHMPESFMRHYILLPAGMAVPPQHYGAAVQAIFLFSFSNMTHQKFFLKINKKPLTAFLFRCAGFQLFLS